MSSLTKSYLEFSSFLCAKSELSNCFGTMNSSNWSFYFLLNDSFTIDDVDLDCVWFRVWKAFKFNTKQFHSVKKWHHRGVLIKVWIYYISNGWLSTKHGAIYLERYTSSFPNISCRELWWKKLRPWLTVIYWVVVVQDPPKQFEGVVSVDQRIQLMGMPDKGKVIAWYKKSILIILLEEQMVLIPLNCFTQELLIPVMWQGNLMIKDSLSLASALDVILTRNPAHMWQGHSNLLQMVLWGTLDSIMPWLFLAPFLELFLQEFYGRLKQRLLHCSPFRNWEVKASVHAIPKQCLEALLGPRRSAELAELAKEAKTVHT